MAENLTLILIKDLAEKTTLGSEDYIVVGGADAFKIGWDVFKNQFAAIAASGSYKDLKDVPLSAAGKRFNVIPLIGSDGVMEIGTYIDFHLSGTDTGDYAQRLYATTDALRTNGNFGIGGTLAVTGDLTAANIGTRYSASATINLTAADATVYKEGASITLPAGTYMVLGVGAFPAASGRKLIQLYNKTSAAGLGTLSFEGSGYASQRLPHFLNITSQSVICTRLAATAAISGCSANIQAIRIA